MRLLVSLGVLTARLYLLAGLVTVVLCLLRWHLVIRWPWPWVTAPVWAPLALAVVLFGVAGVGAGISALST